MGGTRVQVEAIVCLSECGLGEAEVSICGAGPIRSLLREGTALGSRIGAMLSGGLTKEQVENGTWVMIL